MSKKINFIKPERVSIKDHPELNESWLQNEIAKDPSILGLGDLVLRDKERIQPRTGRLDLLLQDPDINKRYEVEVQLGRIDESHIIRTIEYWDLERKRYPQYEHCAVIIAEDVTSRFLNIISLFNGYIPLIAIQVNAYRIEDNYFTVFTKILDEVQLGLFDDDEEEKEVTDRTYWDEKKGTPNTVKIADDMLDLINSVSPVYELKYNKFYIGLMKNSQIDNFVIFKAKKKFCRIEVRTENFEEIEKIVEESEIEDTGYSRRHGRYNFNLRPSEVSKNKETLLKIIRKVRGIDEEIQQKES